MGGAGEPVFNASSDPRPTAGELTGQAENPQISCVAKPCRSWCRRVESCFRPSLLMQDNF